VPGTLRSVGTTAGREILLNGSKIPARDLSLRAEITPPIRDERRPLYHHVVRTAFKRAISATCWSRMPHTSTATRTFFAHFGTNRTQGPNGGIWRCGMRRTIKLTSRRIQPD
jgi:hypothetical protein